MSKFLHLLDDLLPQDPLILLILEYLIRLYKSQSLIVPILSLVMLLLHHHLSLKRKLSLLIVLLDYPLIHLSLLLVMDLVHDLVQ